MWPSCGSFKFVYVLVWQVAFNVECEIKWRTCMLEMLASVASFAVDLVVLPRRQLETMGAASFAVASFEVASFVAASLA